MIESYHKGEAPLFELYALGLAHKHLPEIMHYTGITRRPILCPRSATSSRECWCSCAMPGYAARRPQGQRPARRAGRALRQEQHPRAMGERAARRGRRQASKHKRSTTPTSSSCACLPTKPTAMRCLVARLDNLGKGASGAAVQNLEAHAGPVIFCTIRCGDPALKVVASGPHPSIIAPARALARHRRRGMKKKSMAFPGWVVAAALLAPWLPPQGHRHAYQRRISRG